MTEFLKIKFNFMIDLLILAYDCQIYRLDYDYIETKKKNRYIEIPPFFILLQHRLFQLFPNFSTFF